MDSKILSSVKQILRGRVGPGPNSEIISGLLPESQGQNLALTALYVPHSLTAETSNRHNPGCIPTRLPRVFTQHDDSGLKVSAAQRICHIQDSRGRILALAFRQSLRNIVTSKYCVLSLFGSSRKTFHVQTPGVSPPRYKSTPPFSVNRCPWT